MNMYRKNRSGPVLSRDEGARQGRAVRAAQAQGQLGGERGFAGAVWPEQAVHLPLAHAQAQATQQLQARTLGLQQRGAAALKDARAGKEATRLFFGAQPKRAVQSSRLPMLLAPGAPASQR